MVLEYIAAIPAGSLMVAKKDFGDSRFQHSVALEGAPLRQVGE